MKPTQQQGNALDEILEWITDVHSEQRELSLSGAAGTGKTTLMEFLAECPTKSRVTWTATTGKAARLLGELIDDTRIKVRTLHSCLYWPPNERPEHIEFGAVRLFKGNPGDVVVIDEASMITEEIKATLESTWLQDGAKILYVGDGYQLPPVGDDYSVFAEVSGPRLTEVIRNDDDVLYAANYIRVEGHVLTKSRGSYEFRRSRVWTALDDYLNDRDDHALITWRNKIRAQANDTIRHKMGYGEPYPEPGEPVLYCRNGQGVLNGQMVRTEWIEPPHDRYGKVEVQLFGDAEGHTISVSTQGRNSVMDGAMPHLTQEEWKEYQAAIGRTRSEQGGSDVRPIPITWGYVLTAHKAQGSEFRRATIFLTDWDSNSKPFKQDTQLPDGSTMKFAARWCYTALTRAKERATLIIGPQ